MYTIIYVLVFAGDLKIITSSYISNILYYFRNIADIVNVAIRSKSRGFGSLKAHTIVITAA